MRNLVVGVVVGCADAGEGTSTEHPEARQTVEEILIRTGDGSLAVTERGAQNRHLLLRGSTTSAQARKSSTQVHVARRAVRNLTALHHGVRRGQVVIRTPAEPDLLKAAAVGAVTLPLAPAQTRLSNIGHQNLTDFIQLNTCVGDQKIQVLTNLRHRLNTLDGQVQAVVVVLHVVIRHDPVEGRVAHFAHHSVHPVPAVVGVPHLHLEVLGVALPLDAVTVEAVREEILTGVRHRHRQRVRHTRRVNRAGLVRAGGRQALIRQHHHLRCTLFEVACRVQFPGLQDCDRVVLDRKIELLLGNGLAAVADPGTKLAGSAQAVEFIRHRTPGRIRDREGAACPARGRSCCSGP